MNAIITDSTIIVASRPPISGDAAKITNASHMAIIADRLGVKHLWIASRPLAARMTQDAFWERDGYHTWHPSPAFGTVRSETASGERYIHDLAVYDAAISPQDALTTVADYQEAMGTDAWSSPGMTALRVLKEINDGMPTRSGWLRPMSEAVVKDERWKMLPDIAHVAPAPDRTYPYVHAYDKNSAHMAAATSVSYGSGDPVKVKGTRFDKNKPGYWEIRAGVESSQFNGIAYPSPFGGAERVVSGWFPTATVKSAMNCGWAVTVKHGYLWEESHDIFGLWVQALWAARVATLGTPANRWVKNSFNAAKGMFAHRPDGGIAWYSRPDWGIGIVADHNMRQIHKIASYVRDYHIAYKACLVDELWVCSDDPNPDTAMPHLTDRSGSLGGYKVTGTYTGSVASAIQSAKTPAEIRAACKAVRK